MMVAMAQRKSTKPSMKASLGACYCSSHLKPTGLVLPSSFSSTLVRLARMIDQAGRSQMTHDVDSAYLLNLGALSVKSISVC